ncbi:SRPBCC domain-containing protein [Paenibacillus campinasensis]|uniref:SRPBCC domain-containing protein n=1 Tax=Paenibacillus campinasensis TaxID=66347 RepID=UPI001FD4B26E|nr:SRPBCC domain-containing protein [Paenibacillus campinasensis]
MDDDKRQGKDVDFDSFWTIKGKHQDINVTGDRMMNQYGTLHETNDRYVLRFERLFSHKPEDLFRNITNPDYFSQWYPFATGEMELKEGGKIFFDDGEGSTYEGIITDLKAPPSS